MASSLSGTSLSVTGAIAGGSVTVTNNVQGSQLVATVAAVCPAPPAAGTCLGAKPPLIRTRTIIYGLPAVVGTGNATNRIKTGDTLTVDGTNGVVTIHAA